MAFTGGYDAWKSSAPIEREDEPAAEEFLPRYKLNAYHDKWLRLSVAKLYVQLKQGGWRELDEAIVPENDVRGAIRKLREGRRYWQSAAMAAS